MIHATTLFTWSGIELVDVVEYEVNVLDSI
jgi:hypothetical protein